MPSPAGPIPDLLFVLIPIAILIGIPLTGPMTARMSGWGRLADAYATEQECRGFKLIGRRGMFGKWMGYKGVLTYGVDDQGFYLSVIWIFRSGHKPILVPWGELRGRCERIWFRDWLVLEFTQVPGLTFALRSEDAKILNANGAKFPAV